MLTEQEETALKAMLRDCGLQGLVDGLATVAQNCACDRDAAAAEILAHDAEVLRRTVPKLWHGRMRRVPRPPLRSAAVL